MPFAGGLKSYLDNPAAILQFRPTTCLKCSHDGLWHRHGKRPRHTSLDGCWRITVVFRVRCPGCWTTTTLLPDGILPRLQHSLETVGRAVAGYLTTVQSYRQLALSLNGTPLAPGERLSTYWGSPSAPAPGPSTICRWVARFSQGAGAWWDVLAGLTQARLPHPLVVPTSPPSLPRKARTPAKARQLELGWYLLWLLRLLLTVLGVPVGRWPQALLHAPQRPLHLDHTGWFRRVRGVPP